MDAKKPDEDVASTIDVQVKDYARNIKVEHNQYILVIRYHFCLLLMEDRTWNRYEQNQVSGF
ncbi:endonuclease [Blastocystis sp. subtype 4]|uniref:endonuclease n=1 Tax=Blastocystis sp. subtype 4 TaxID=944170 RepID=UPI0007122897|nr:endonuclease [Blastocystis sp. subtype 4]KNB41167.1 endonuclease [Blastocystis sp. subtype 4]|eukprot:XP_014524610.1 endonuclease [Blastocystis sp. subtype 4]